MFSLGIGCSLFCAVAFWDGYTTKILSEIDIIISSIIMLGNNGNAKSLSFSP